MIFIYLQIVGPKGRSSNGKSGIIYLELNKELSVGNQLKDEYSIDGVHLSAQGYKIWSAAVIKVLLRLKI